MSVDFREVCGEAVDGLVTANRRSIDGEVSHQEYWMEVGDVIDGLLVALRSDREDVVSGSEWVKRKAQKEQLCTNVNSVIQREG